MLDLLFILIQCMSQSSVPKTLRQFSGPLHQRIYFNLNNQTERSKFGTGLECLSHLTQNILN